MKALTLIQPYATLVAIGAKRYETRSWRTGYRGPLAIHAAKSFPGWARERCRQEPFRSVLRAAGIHSPDALPRGRVVAVCRLVEVSRITSLDALGWPLGDHEAAFGDYTPGRCAWLLDQVTPLPAPVPARGAQGLWTWRAVPADLLARVAGPDPGAAA